MTAALALGFAPAAVFAATVTTYAGSGVAGISDGAALSAQFIAPYGVAWGNDGRLYVTDAAAQRIRVILPNGIVRTMAGSGTVSATGLVVAGGYVNGPGRIARFDTPTGIVVAPDGRVLVADTGNRCIRAIALDGTVTTFAGDPARAGARDGAASAASFARPTGVALGPNASIFVADGVAGVRQIAADGSVTTLHLPLRTAIGIASSLRGGGMLYVTGSDGLWVIDLAMLAADSPGAVSLLRSGMAAFARPAPMPGVNALAAFGQHAVGVPFGIAAFPDGVGLVYTDVSTHTVRYMNPATQNVDVIGGRAAGDAADQSGAFADGPTDRSRLDDPTGVAVSANDIVAVADAGNKRIRLIRNVDRSAPEDATNGVFPDLGARNGEYRILFIGSSYVWGSGPFSQSPAAAIEARLRADGTRARIATVRMGSDVHALRSYLDVVAEARTFDCVVILVSDYVPRESYPSLVGSGSLAATQALWVPRLRDDLSTIKRDLDAGGIPSLFVALPLPFEVGMTEWTMPQVDISWGATGFDESAPPNESLERMATRPLVEAKLDWLNAWDVFYREIRSPEHRPLYLSIDGHLTSHGNEVLGNAIAQRLERERPWAVRP